MMSLNAIAGPASHMPTAVSNQQPYALALAKHAAGSCGVFMASAYLALERDTTGYNMAMSAMLSTSLWTGMRAVSSRGDLFSRLLNIGEAASFAYLAGGIGFSFGESCGRAAGDKVASVAGVVGAVALGSGAAVAWLLLDQFV